MSDFFGSINILDVIIIALTILLLIFGIWRGMFKMVYGFISSLLALVLAILLITTVVTFVIDNTYLDDWIVDQVAQPLSSSGPNSHQIIDFYDLDGDPETPPELGFNPGDGPKPFDEIFGGSRLRFLASPLKSIVQSQVEQNGPTPFLKAVVSVITAYILSAAAFVVLWIILYIIIRIIFMIIKKLVSNTYIGYYLNKVLGGVLGFIISAALVFGFMTIVRLLGNYEVIIPVNQMIEDSTVAKLIYDNNFLYNFIADKIDIQSIIDGIMETVGAIS
ncbi:MAG: CvpA family protein [Bacillota bacterium]|jgi:uncharacterized membrane protein required for colicin V production|nr:CvpA family protein [Bacillota bacterium]HHU43359.1 hypothetical protein [Clostridiales bacterium]